MHSHKLAHMNDVIMIVILCRAFGQRDLLSGMWKYHVCKWHRYVKPAIHISTFSRQQFVCRQVLGNYPSADRFFKYQMSTKRVANCWWRTPT